MGVVLKKLCSSSCASTRDIQHRMCSRTLGKRLPEVDVLTRDEFARKSRTYWTIRPGAEAAILTAAVIGVLIGLVVVPKPSMRHNGEYRGIRDIKSSWSIPSFRGAHCAYAGPDCGSGWQHSGAASGCSKHWVRKSLIPWIYTPWWLLLVMVMPSWPCAHWRPLPQFEVPSQLSRGGCFRA